MNNEKTQIQVKENHKRAVFIIKLLVFIFLLVFETFFFNRLNEMPELIIRIIKTAIFFLGSNIIISLGRMFIVRFYLRRKGINMLHSNFVLGINRIASILMGIITIIAIMLLVNIDPVNFFTSITIVAAAIALLSKDYITNMINGLIIMFSDQLALGDNVRIGDQKGKIMDVTLINLVLLNEDDDIIMIPNNIVLNSQVINHSRQYIKKLTFDFEIKIHLLNLDKVESFLKEALRENEAYITENSFSMKTIYIHKDAVKVKCQFLLNASEKQIERDIKRKINQAIIDLAGEAQ
ncbi:mechanosensitive ion channel family protein [Anditalea andensis]|uniref:Mechanosensitive ion channel protein MscS n=1 Tax=Anditalea andensis TaxID=1048983 RepID=A0A074KX41_9BACT|nr:mechanosensitive ion channel domain-containing protein [Anditalea andensis]KEO72800.1 mechanosensitive ion channel protein MscS [Anditalea andensis]